MMMAQGSHTPLDHCLPVLLFLTGILLLKASPTCGLGFRLKLIHRDSSCSPLHPENKFADLQQTPMQGPFYRGSIKMLRPSLQGREAQYLVALSIGTGPGLRSYHLLLDTGSPITWTQCHPCDNCYHQSEPLFHPAESPTYRLLPSNDSLCHPPLTRLNGSCAYRLTYVDKTAATGVISREVFTFQSSNGGVESVPRLLFGCTHECESKFENEPAGIFAMNDHPLSAAVQLAGRTDGRFSYCLFPPVPGASGFLRFGDDIRMKRSEAQVTPLLKYPASSRYHINMQGISVNDKRVPIPKDVFQRRRNRTGGVTIDTGTSWSHLIRPAYDAVRKAMEDYFKPFNLRRHLDSDLCYAMPDSSSRSKVEFPTMTLHFYRADLRIQAEHLFLLRSIRNTTYAFCLALSASDKITLLGAFQQFNTRFVFDIRNYELWFAPEDCAYDGTS